MAAWWTHLHPVPGPALRSAISVLNGLDDLGVLFDSCHDIGFGIFKGMYDANIFASLHDVVPVERRGVAVGTMNSLAWLGGGMAPIVIALAAGRYGMSACISATAGIYLLIGLLMLLGAMRLAQKERFARRAAGGQ